MKCKTLLIVPFFILLAIITLRLLFPVASGVFCTIQDDVGTTINAQNTFPSSKDSDGNIITLGDIIETPFGIEQDILQSNTTTELSVTNALGESMRIRMESDATEYVDYVKIAFARIMKDIQMPDGVRAVVEKQDGDIIVTFPIDRNEPVIGGTIYARVTVDIATKSVQKPVGIGW